MSEPAVQTRSGRLDHVHEQLRRLVEVPTKRYLWVPADAIKFVPRLCDTIYGDGRALFHLSTLNQRPAFYVIRCCSTWNESNYSMDRHFGEFTDLMLSDLEEQFGSARPDSEEDDPDILENWHPFPALDDEGGCQWGQCDWPTAMRHMTEFEVRFGYRSNGRLLRSEFASEDQWSRWADDGGPALEPRWWR